jgi:hypothetical protein
MEITFFKKFYMGDYIDNRLKTAPHSVIASPQGEAISHEISLEF